MILFVKYICIYHIRLLHISCMGNSNRNICLEILHSSHNSLHPEKWSIWPDILLFQHLLTLYCSEHIWLTPFGREVPSCEEHAIATPQRLKPSRCSRNVYGQLKNTPQLREAFSGWLIFVKHIFWYFLKLHAFFDNRNRMPSLIRFTISHTTP